MTKREVRGDTVYSEKGRDSNTVLGPFYLPPSDPDPPEPVMIRSVTGLGGTGDRSRLGGVRGDQSIGEGFMKNV